MRKGLNDRALCIVNPAAGRGRGRQAWGRAASVLREAGMGVDAAHTEGRGHAAALAEAAVQAGRPAVVAVGGDGTIQEVVNGLLPDATDDDARQGSTLPLGIIPAGSGNDFVKQLGIPQDPAAAARALLEAVPRAVDAGRVGDRWFVNGIGIGFDARVAIEARRPSPLRGEALYVWALLRALRSHRPTHVRVTVDGTRVASGEVTMVTVTNGPCHGGGFWLCPDALVDDGLIDVLVVGALGRIGVVSFLARSRRGAHLERPGMELLRGRHVLVTSDDPLPVHADGEIVAEDTQRVEIELLPERLTVLRPMT